MKQLMFILPAVMLSLSIPPKQVASSVPQPKQVVKKATVKKVSKDISLMGLLFKFN